MEDIKKHLFWSISGVVVLTISIMWFLAIGSLNDERAQNESRISSVFDKLEQIKGKNEKNHPNASFDDGMNVILTSVKTDIRKTWQDKYNVQKQSLNWPVGPAQLDRITANYFEPLAPIELKVEMNGVINPLNNSVKTEISQIARIKYKDFTAKYLPTLADIVAARWGPDPNVRDKETTGGEGDATETTTDNDHLVVWNDSNQNALISRFAWANDVPTTLEILYAQEDLWVLNQWLKIIADMNKTADAAYNAKVTDIIGIDLAKNGAFIGPTGVDLAKEAILSGGKIAGGTDGGMGGGMGGMMGGMDGGGMEGMMGGGGEGGEDSGGEGEGSSSESSDSESSDSGDGEPSNDPGDLRYVDDAYRPLAISDLRAALKITADSQNVRPKLAIAKRYPTRIRLTIDLRYLHQFLAACGNAELSIEVLQVRINAPSGMNKGGGSAGGMGGMGEGGMGEGGMTGGMGGMTGGMGGMTGGMGGMGSGTVIQVPTTQYHVEVEIYGIVHIYNPVNLAALGIDPQEDNANNNNTTGPGGEAE